MNFSSMLDEKRSFAALQHIHYRGGVLSEGAQLQRKIQNMETNYLVIETLVQQARQQRSQALGELISAGWNRCKKLFQGKSSVVQPGTAIWHRLPR